MDHVAIRLPRKPLLLSLGTKVMLVSMLSMSLLWAGAALQPPLGSLAWWYIDVFRIFFGLVIVSSMFVNAALLTARFVSHHVLSKTPLGDHLTEQHITLTPTAVRTGRRTIPLESVEGTDIRLGALQWQLWLKTTAGPRCIARSDSKPRLEQLCLLITAQAAIRRRALRAAGHSLRGTPVPAALAAIRER